MSGMHGSPETVGMSASRLDRLRPIMQSYVEDRGVVGISTMISRRGQVVHAEQFGHRDREADLPMTADTIFRIYSMTKPIVSTALMLLHEEGRFQLEHPIANYLPAFGAVKVLAADGTLVDPVRPIDVRDLLTHTSGLTYDFMIDTPVAQMYRDAQHLHDATRTLEAMIDELATLPLAFQPGARWHYSVGIDVAARLIEVISGQPLGDFLRERLFDPLGMVDTGFGVPDAELDRLAAMYGLPDLVGENYSAVQLLEAALERLQRTDRRVGDLSDRHPGRLRARWARPVLDHRRLHALRPDAGERAGRSTASASSAARRSS